MGSILSPQKKFIKEIKAKILQPALTSHFQCQFIIPPKVSDQLKSNSIIASSELNDTLTISCTDASLPGSSLATHELNNDFTGITQRHVYRRLYDDRAQFTFFVDQNYIQIRIFEIWMRFIAGEELSFGESNSVAYRANFPDNYKTSLYLTKFERDIKNYMSYTFVNAFPIQIDSMPVSYDSSQLLKCTVSFGFDRYVLSNPKSSSTSIKDPAPSSSSSTSNNLFGSATNNTATAFNPSTNLGLDYGKYTTTGGVDFPPAASSGNAVKTAYGDLNLF